MSVELFHSIEGIQPNQWDLIKPPQYPFLAYSFLHALEKSEAIGAEPCCAQGEHKIARGFRPVKTYSAHQLKDPTFQGAIIDYIALEQAHLDKVILHLSRRLPFKSP